MITLPAKDLRQEMAAAAKAITVVKRGRDVTVYPHAEIAQISALQPGTTAVVIDDLQALNRYLRPLGGNIPVAIFPKRKLIGKKHGGSGVCLSMQTFKL